MHCTADKVSSTHKTAQEILKINKNLKVMWDLINLNDLCDLEKKDKVMRFNPGLPLALVPLCTKFGDNSSGTEQKPFFISHCLK